MTERNRVTPQGEVRALALRGAWTGNRGVVHGGPSGRDIVRSHTTRAWITCALSYGDAVAPRWEPRRWTALFFHDEAVALAAGHRPCALCRRGAFVAYRDAVRAASGRPGLRAPDLDRRLHAERRTPGRAGGPRRHAVAWDELPVGAFTLLDGAPALVLGGWAVGWDERGYGAARPRPTGTTATVLTPPTSLAALRAGYPVQVDEAALRAVRAAEAGTGEIGAARSGAAEVRGGAGGRA